MAYPSATARLVLFSALRGLSGARASMTTSSHLRITTTTDATPAVDAIKDAIKAGNLATSGAVAQEQIRSFYWWDGAVQDDEETRLSFVTSADFDTVADVLAKAHNYDVPMIVGEGGALDESSAEHWKGIVAAGDHEATAVASSLAASRLVACAQVAADGTLAVKTVKAAIAPIRAKLEKDANDRGSSSVPSVTWAPIVGNSPYLEWVSTETKLEGQCDS